MKNLIGLESLLSSCKDQKNQSTYQEQQSSPQNVEGFSVSSRKSSRVDNEKKSSQKSSHIKGNNPSRKGSLSLKNKLIDFLVKTAQIQRKLQIIKQTLCEDQSFTPGSLFHRIDRNRNGYLLEREIQQFLMENKVEFKGSELKILYGKMNSEQSENGVRQREFQNFILPNQNPRLRYLTMRRPVYIPLPEQRLPQQNQWLLSKLFFEIMKEEAKLKEINATLISSYDFNPQTVFDFLANIEGFITGESLNNFMLNENCEVTVEQIGCLIKLLDKQGQGRICFDNLKFFLATLGLKKQHQIFDELSPIPALKNFVIPTLQLVLGIKGTLEERVTNNKMHRQLPQKRGLTSSGKINRSRRS